MSKVSREAPGEDEGLIVYDELRRVIEAVEGAKSELAELRKWLLENLVVSPHELPGHLRLLVERLTQGLAGIGSAANEAFEHILRWPAVKFKRGQKLTRTEYYHLVAAGVFEQGGAKVLGLSPYDDYEAFSFLFYEDEKRIAYINPGQPHHSERRARLGIPPEEARLDALRPEQREFFKKHLPETYERFKR